MQVRGAWVMKRPRILVVVAVSVTVRAFLLNYLKRLSDEYDVTLCCTDDPELINILPPTVQFVPIAIRRSIAPMADIWSLMHLAYFIRKNQFDMIHSVTPKAGLLAQLAAWWNGINVRIHTFTGQVWATRSGASRALLKSLDCLIAATTTHILTDSNSQRDFLIKEGVASPTKISVLGQGSISGVDINRFQPAPKIRQAIRSKFGYKDADVLALFVGRLNRDKGVLDLVTAFAQVSKRLPNLALLLVGPDEEDMISAINHLSGGSLRLKVLGSTSRPEDYMAAADFFCLPSYREGFGSVVIEAAACGLPAMVSEIYGLTDAVENEVSGVLHPPRDVEAIAARLERFAIDRAWREKLGVQARKRALAKFSADAVVEAQIHYVHSLLEKKA